MTITTFMTDKHTHIRTLRLYDRPGTEGQVGENMCSMFNRAFFGKHFLYNLCWQVTTLNTKCDSSMFLFCFYISDFVAILASQFREPLTGSSCFMISLNKKPTQLIGYVNKPICLPLFIHQ